MAIHGTIFPKAMVIKVRSSKSFPNQIIKSISFGIIREIPFDAVAITLYNLHTLNRKYSKVKQDRKVVRPMLIIIYTDISYAAV